jgi:non-canonical purine NTP pyrophosphatase (RdgB/HAM1 family)
MKTNTIVLATRNPHKTEEIKALLNGLPITVKDLRDFPEFPEVEETGDTLEENARLKALAAHVRTGLPAIADDTGLEVYYLLGRPGVYSARYAGENVSYDDNNKKLLRELTQVPARKRQARFRCVVALVDGRDDRFFEGRVEGRIGLVPRGMNGFGYDPLFIPEGYDSSYAELTQEEKNSISHRGRAIRALIEYLSGKKDTHS